jgi:uncharacterized delta-60 repeat protein
MASPTLPARLLACASLVALLTVPCTAKRRGVPPGSLDATFGQGGKVTIDFFADQDIGSGLAVQPDGKLVVAGMARDDGKASFAVARLMPDGTPDTTFGQGGKMTFDVSEGNEGAGAVALQPDGKIVVVGTACPAGTNLINCYDFVVARLTPGGALDASFGKNGIVTTDFTGGFDGAAAVVVQPDGKLLAGGVTATGVIGRTIGDFALARYNADGTLDAESGQGGKVSTDFTGGYDGAVALLLQPDGKVVLAGTAAEGEAYRDFGLARYTAGGVLDATFGQGGKVTTNFGSKNHGNDAIGAIALVAGNKIVAVGASSNDDFEEEFAAARYNVDGTLDAAFGQGGMLTLDVASSDDQASSLVVQSDGKLLVGGVTGGQMFIGLQGPVVFEETASPTRADFALVRLTADGQLDATFGNGGKVTTDFFASSDTARFVRQPDGKVVGVGFARRQRGSTNSIVARIAPVPDADMALARYETGDVAVPDFSISLATPALTVERRKKADVVVNVARTGDFAGRVTVTPASTSALKVKLKPASASTTGASVTFKLKVKPTATPGTYEILFTGADTEGRQRTATLTLTIT